MSSILDALKKLEEEKAARQAAASAEPVEAPEPVLDSEQFIEQLRKKEAARSQGFALSTKHLIGGGVAFVVLLVGVSTLVSIAVVRSNAASNTVPVPPVAASIQVAEAQPTPTPETPVPAPAPEAVTVTPPPTPAPAPEPVVVTPPPAPAPAPEPVVVTPPPAPAPAPEPVVVTPPPAPAPPPVQAAAPAPVEAAPVAPAPAQAAAPAPEAAPTPTPPPAPAPEVVAAPSPAPEPAPAPELAAPVQVAAATPESTPEPPALRIEPGPVNLRELPMLRNAERIQYGLEDLRLNMIREATPQRPEAMAIINLNKVYVGEMIPATGARLIAVERHGIGIDVGGTRFYVQH